VSLKNILVLGGSGFIGGHLVKKFLSEGHYVRVVDLKSHEYGVCPSEFICADLANFDAMKQAVHFDDGFDEIYQLAADMGGAGYIFTGENDVSVLQNSASINLNLLRVIFEEIIAKEKSTPKIFYSSSACIYPEESQLDPNNPGLREVDAYPANPDSEYGWEKLFSERLYLAYSRKYKLQVRIARFHNIYGPMGTWDGGREKAPAAICRKVALAKDGGEIEIWGDGKQTRSFLYIEDCITAVERLIDSDVQTPINIGSEEMVSIDELVSITAEVAGKAISIKHIPGPQGVRGRNSNNDFVREQLLWDAFTSLKEGIGYTYSWISQQVARSYSVSPMQLSSPRG